MYAITNLSTFSTAEEYVKNTAISNKIRLTAEQKTKAIAAVDALLSNMGNQKPSDYVLRKILQAAAGN